MQWSPVDGSGYTLTSPEPVPYSWLSDYGFGGCEADFETADNSATGKRDGAGRLLSVWQDYVAGTDPTNIASRLTAKIEMRGSEPVVTWAPDLNRNFLMNHEIHKIHESTHETGECLFVSFVYFVVLQLSQWSRGAE